MRPTAAKGFASYWAAKIHNAHPNVNATYLDVHSGVLPISDKVDYQNIIVGAGKFRTTMEKYQEIFDELRKYNNNGPVQGEGGNQPFYQGYADDVDARLILPFNKCFNGKTFPVFIDFDMKKLRDKAFIHGVGYYPCFYATSESDVSKINQQIVLQYIATELAYGHGSYIPTPDLTTGYSNGGNYNLDEFIGYAKLEYDHVFPMQQVYMNANPINIEYYNNGVWVGNASTYIRTYQDYWDYTSNNFMSQVKVTYDNGVVVCVNRSNSQWDVTGIGVVGGWMTRNIVGLNDPVAGISNTTSFSLKPECGWVCYNPLKSGLAKQSQLTKQGELPKEYSLSQNYPNPFNPATTIKYQLPKDGFVMLKVYDILGRVVAELVNEKKQAGYFQIDFNASKLASGVYIMRLIAQSEEGKSFVQTKKMLMLK